MKKIAPDKGGNYVFDVSYLKKFPLIALLIFSVIVTALSVYALIFGVYQNFYTAAFRPVFGILVFVISFLMYSKRRRYIVTSEKVVLYQKWELYFSEIESITLHPGIVGVLEIESKNMKVVIPASDISCPIEKFAEILTERKKNERKDKKHKA